MSKRTTKLELSWSVNHNGGAWRLHPEGHPNDWYMAYNLPANDFEMAVYKASLKCKEYGEMWGYPVELKIDETCYGRGDKSELSPVKLEMITTRTETR